MTAATALLLLAAPISNAASGERVLLLTAPSDARVPVRVAGADGPAEAQPFSPGRVVFVASRASASVEPGKDRSPIENRVAVEATASSARVLVDGALFTEYRFLDAPRPYFFPVIGPGGREMTRAFPMRESKDEERDHPHHRSLWFSHGNVNGVDFWSGTDPKSSPRIVPRQVTGVVSGPVFGEFRAAHDWLDAGGKKLATDERVVRVYALGGAARILEHEITLRASAGDLVLGDTKEGTMAIRLAESLRLSGASATGRALNSRGVAGKDVWGKRAEWIDYAGTIGGLLAGVAAFDHPSNPRHPTWWHAREYGLVAANAFGVHDFEGKERGTGDLRVEKGGSIRFLHAFYFHAGGPEAARVAEVWRAWADANSRAAPEAGR